MRLIKFLPLLEVSTQHSSLLLNVVAHNFIESFRSVLEFFMPRLLIELHQLISLFLLLFNLFQHLDAFTFDFLAHLIHTTFPLLRLLLPLVKLFSLLFQN